MANVKGGKDNSDKIEKLAGKTLGNPKASSTERRLAGAVLAHADGKPAKGAKKK